VYKTLLQRWPAYPTRRACRTRSLRSYERDRNLNRRRQGARGAGPQLTPRAAPGTRRKKDNPEAPRGSRSSWPRTRCSRRATTNVHAGARSARPSGKRTRRTSRSSRNAKALYRTAAELYEKYWLPTRIRSGPTSSRVLAPTRSTTRASCRRHRRLSDGARFAASTTGNQDRLGVPMIKAYEDIIDDMRRDKKIDDPPIPDEKNTKPAGDAGRDAGHLPPVHGGHRLVRRLHQERAHAGPQVRGGGESRCATTTGPRRAGAWVDHAAYCGPNPEIRVQGLRCNFTDLLYRLQRRGRGAEDCALGKLLNVADQFMRVGLWQVAKATPYLARIAQIKASVKTTIIHQAPAAVVWRTKRRARTKS